MNKKYFFLACLFLLGFIPAGKAAGIIVALPIDTSRVVVKNISQDILKPYRYNKDFIYQTTQPVINSFWSKILYKLEQILDFTINNKVFSTLVILTFFVIFVLLIILLVGGDFQTMFSRNKSDPGSVNSFINDIERTDFDYLITQEIEKENLNQAIRYLYLQLLQVLSQHQLILWQKDKTNREYIQELSQKAFFNDFKIVTNAYEYVWYGKFQISMQVFSDVRNNVNQLIRQING